MGKLMHVDPNVGSNGAFHPQSHGNPPPSSSNLNQQINGLATKAIHQSTTETAGTTSLPKATSLNNTPMNQKLMLMQNRLNKSNTTKTQANQIIAGNEETSKKIHLADKKEIVADKKTVVAETAQIAEKKIETTELKSALNAAKKEASGIEHLRGLDAIYGNQSEFKKHLNIVTVNKNGTINLASGQAASPKDLKLAMKEHRLATVFNKQIYLDLDLDLDVEEGKPIQFILPDGTTQDLTIRFLNPDYKKQFYTATSDFIRAALLQQAYRTDSGVQIDDDTNKAPRSKDVLKEFSVKQLNKEEVDGLGQQNTRKLRQILAKLLENRQSEEIFRNESVAKKTALKAEIEDKFIKYCEAEFELLHQAVSQEAIKGHISKKSFDLIVEKWGASLPPFPIRVVNDSVLWKELKSKMTEEFAKRLV